MDDLERFYVGAVARIPGMGADRVRLLMERLGSARAVWEHLPGAFEKIPAASLRKMRNFIKEEPDYPERLQKSCEAIGARLITWQDTEYPEILGKIYDPPPVLYVRGSLKRDADRIAVVGARKFTPYGEAVAEDFAKQFAEAGLTVVSGGAYGIDSCAHKGALKAGEGHTVAVLGCGVDVAYPAANRRLFEKILERGGALISEYVPGTQPLPVFFPARNRIIAGLSRGTVVIEAARRSGSLITAEFALNEGRNVYAVPGSIFSKMSEGCHHLLKEGAKLASSAEDVLEDFGLTDVPKAKPKLNLSIEEQRVYQVLSFEHPLTIDEIVNSLKDGDVSSLSFLLLQMELKGVVVENELHAYRRAERE